MNGPKHLLNFTDTDSLILEPIIPISDISLIIGAPLHDTNIS